MTPVGYICELVVIPKDLTKKGKFGGGRGLNDYGILRAWEVMYFGISEGKGG